MKIEKINEGQFSWFTQDTNEQIPSYKPFVVAMFDNKGNKFVESEYAGYGEFANKDYYDLLAEMNGYTQEDATALGKELRIIGIDIAFKDFPTKNEDGIVLYPALVSDQNFDYTSHDFSKEPESDPDQGWEVESDEDRCTMCGGDNTHMGHCYDCDEEDEDEEDMYEGICTSIADFKLVLEKKKAAKLSKEDKEFISNKIKKLIDEGRPRNQAIAIAYSYLEKEKEK